MSHVAGVVLFPGSGSSSTHSSLLAMEHALSPLPVARVDFPYRKAGKSFPDKAPVLVQCVKNEVREFAASLGVATSSLVIGGRSMGGRMCGRSWCRTRFIRRRSPTTYERSTCRTFAFAHCVSVEQKMISAHPTNSLPHLLLLLRTSRGTG